MTRAACLTEATSKPTRGGFCATVPDVAPSTISAAMNLRLGKISLLWFLSRGVAAAEQVQRREW